MPHLNDPKKEAFCRFVVQGKSKREAAIAAGYSHRSASTLGGKLAKRDDVQARLVELQSKVERQTVKNALSAVDFAISSKANRVQALDLRWSKLQQVIEERAKDPAMAKVPGGTTGLIVRQLRSIGNGPNAKIIPEFVIDTGLLKEIRAHEQQAAQELGQWIQKQELTGEDGKPLEINTNDVRKRISNRVAGIASKLGTGSDSR